VFPIGLKAVKNPRGPMSPDGASAAAYAAGHVKPSALAHAMPQTDSNLGESCDVCHANGGAFAVS
jgi:cytochrome c5